MSRRGGQHDVVIAGGGVVGAACALALAAHDLDVVLVEPKRPAAWVPDAPDLRVYAIASDSADVLASTGAWRDILAARAQPYRRMRVHDAAGGEELVFDADAFARRELGWIVEHGLLVDRLWAKLERAGVRVRDTAGVADLERNDADGVALRLDDGTRLEARLAIAADGADSALRRLAGIDAFASAYRQQGLVAYVRTALPHADTAWQRFLPGGPLAFLPCADGRCSIVWSLPDTDAAAMRALDDAAFGDALTRASGGMLGDVEVTSPRVAFPLQRQLAERYVAGRVLVLGDAAHVVHPLAGQGVNLGLRDVAALSARVGDAIARRHDWASSARLERWARARRSENALAAFGFDAINRLFSNDAVAPTLLRGPLLGLGGRVPALAGALWRRASGL